MTTRYGLAPRHAEMLAFIKGYTADRGHAPSFQEVADGLGYKSKASVYRVLALLRERGYVAAIEGKARSLIVVADAPPTPDQSARLMQLETDNIRLQAELNVARLENQSLRQRLESET